MISRMSGNAATAATRSPRSSLISVNFAVRTASGWFRSDARALPDLSRDVLPGVGGDRVVEPRVARHLDAVGGKLARLAQVRFRIAIEHERAVGNGTAAIVIERGRSRQAHGDS
jgi:hypothetical protein